MEYTDDERDLILKIREWKDGIPAEALGKGKECGVYISLVSARADLYRMALRHGENDALERRERMLKLISPDLLIKLCKAWEDLREREREEREWEIELREGEMLPI